MVEKKQCKENEHNWKALYYRKKAKGETQAWVKLKNFQICDKCEKIIKVKTDVKEIN